MMLKLFQVFFWIGGTLRVALEGGASDKEGNEEWQQERI